MRRKYMMLDMHRYAYTVELSWAKMGWCGSARAQPFPKVSREIFQAKVPEGSEGFKIVQ